MQRLRGNQKYHKAFFFKDYSLDHPGSYAIPAGATTKASTLYLNVRGFKTFTMWLTIPQLQIINGSELGIAVLARPDDSTGTYAWYLPLKTNLNLADFRVNIGNAALFDYSIAFGGNALNYTGYSFSNFVPYIKTTLDHFDLTYWSISCIT